MSNIKNIAKRLLSAAITALVAGLILIIIGGFGVHHYASITQSNALQECETSHEELLYYGLITPDTTPEMVVQNCLTLQDRIQDLLTQYGGGDVPVFVTGQLTTFCGEMTTGCVTKFASGNAMLSVMSISFTADYYHGLEHTVAHEYVHVLTSTDEASRLLESPEIWTETYTVDGVTETVAIDPLEGIADCGISYFTGVPFTGGSYMTACTEQQIDIAYAVIEDRF